MSDYQYDLFVIGAGSGGVRAARVSASLGARVAIAENQYLGGTCVNVGCVPKKFLVYASHYGEDFSDSEAYGWCKSAVEFSWPTFIANKNIEIERLNGIYQRLLDDSGVQTLFGSAKIIDPHQVEVNGARYSTQRILVAVGGIPYTPDFPGKEHTITSNEAFFLDELPKRVVVVGGGYIAVEFAGIFHGLGAKVCQIYRGEQILRTFDNETAAFAAQQYRNKGIDIRCKSNIAFIEQVKDTKLCHLENGDIVEADVVMYATGRRPNIAGLGLDNLKIAFRENGTIVVDDNMQTATASVFALGDVTGGPELTPVAIAEAMVFANNQFAGTTQRMDYSNIPTAVFSQPNIGTVGLTEEAALSQFDKLRIYKSEFTHLKHSLSGSSERTFMKLIVDDSSDRVVGVHMVGAEAGEIVQGLAVALKAGATKLVFDATIGIHPTAAEEFVTMRTAS